MNLIKQIYRAVIPESVRFKRTLKQRKKREDEIKNKVLTYYRLNPSKDKEINEALEYLKKNDLSVFPYPFFLDYVQKPIELKRDAESHLPYVMHYGKKLYFKRSWTNERIVDAYRFLLAEQDQKSAHCYLNDEYKIEDGSVVVDVGAAEGIFALNEIEKINHLYLIETDPEWIECLNQTFAPWKNKITIINKFVSNSDDEKNIKLDTYFKEKGMIDFLKIDVDGAEQELIYGAEKTITDKVKRMAICTYHKPDDNRDFSEYLIDKKYKIKNSDGYMLFYYFDDFVPPYFRRGLIKAEKIS